MGIVSALSRWRRPGWPPLAADGSTRSPDHPRTASAQPTKTTCFRQSTGCLPSLVQCSAPVALSVPGLQHWHTFKYALPGLVFVRCYLTPPVDCGLAPGIESPIVDRAWAVWYSYAASRVGCSASRRVRPCPSAGHPGPPQLRILHAVSGHSSLSLPLRPPLRLPSSPSCIPGQLDFRASPE